MIEGQNMNNFTRHEVNAQLERILASPGFLHSSVLSKFLAHIVSETLEGRGHELKEYTIAVSALHKEADFNPQIDSIVRIHAGRLRRALRDYYQADGLDDGISIAVPKGSYVPVFATNHGHRPVLQEQGDTSSRIELERGTDLPGNANGNLRWKNPSRKPSVQVTPFKLVADGDANAHSSLTEYLSTELTKFQDLAVISAGTEGFVPRADYSIRGSIHLADHRARVFVQLHGVDGRQHWANTFDVSYEDLWKMEDEIVTRTVASIAGINGVIACIEAQYIQEHEETSAQRQLSYWYKKHVNDFDPQSTRMARHYYEQLLKEEPANALAAAYLSEVICREAYFTGDDSKAGLLSQSFNLARRALLNDPGCQQAYHAMANVTMVLGKTEECLRTLERGLAINTRSVDFLGGAGAIMIYLGYYERGFALMERALPLTLDSPWAHLVALALHACHKGAFREAIGWLDQVKVDTIWVLLLRATAALHAGESHLANATLAEFRTKYPQLNPADKDTIQHLFVLPEISALVHASVVQLLDEPLYVSGRKGSRFGKK